MAREADTSKVRRGTIAGFRRAGCACALVWCSLVQAESPAPLPVSLDNLLSSLDFAFLSSHLKRFILLQAIP